MFLQNLKQWSLSPLPGWDPIVIEIDYLRLHEDLMRRTATDAFFATYASPRERDYMERRPILLAGHEDMLLTLRDDVVDALCGYLQAWLRDVEDDENGIRLELTLSAPTRIVERLSRRAHLYLLHAMAADVSASHYPALAQKASDRAARSISAIRTTLLRFERPDEFCGEAV